MAKFKAEPFYSVHHSNVGVINFNHVGEYQTTDEGEIAVLKTLCPRYLLCVDEEKAVETKKQPEEAPKKAPAKKSSSK
jgi:hypothetical protein